MGTSYCIMLMGMTELHVHHSSGDGKVLEHILRCNGIQEVSTFVSLMHALTVLLQFSEQNGFL